MLIPNYEDDIDLLAAYGRLLAPAPAGRPYVRINMISSLDGAVTVAGQSGQLGGPADRRVFAVLRSLADVIVVGAGTMRAERYGPVHLSDELQQARRDRGQPSLPQIAVITRSLELDTTSAFFTEAAAPPIVITVANGDRQRRHQVAEVAEVLVAGDDSVDLALAMRMLYEGGAGLVLCEGGPSINGDLIEAGMFDELSLTLSPRLVGGRDKRVVDATFAEPLGMQVAQVLDEDGFLFLRSTPT